MVAPTATARPTSPHAGGAEPPRSATTPAPRPGAPPRPGARSGPRGRATSGGGEDEHGRRPAGDRVDDAEVRAGVRGGEQGEVADLERDRDREEGEGLGVEIPGEGRQRKADDRDQRERRGCRRAGVARARQQDVPARVERRGGQREEEGVERHAAEHRGCGGLSTRRSVDTVGVMERERRFKDDGHDRRWRRQPFTPASFRRPKTDPRDPHPRGGGEAGPERPPKSRG